MWHSYNAVHLQISYAASNRCFYSAANHPLLGAFKITATCSPMSDCFYCYSQLLSEKQYS